jgi:hypothetical protein
MDMTKIRREGAINLFDTHFGILETGPKDERMRGVFWDEMLDVFAVVREHLSKRGWSLEHDSRVDECIRKGYYLGKKGDLQATLECVGRHMQVEFFQTVNDPRGRYGSSKFNRMPHMIHMQCWAEMNALTKWALSMGYHFEPKEHGGRIPIDVSRPIELQIRDRMREQVQYGNDPLDYFNRTWDADRFKRGADGWPLDSEIGSYNRKDRDGALLSNGDIRYFYHWDKHIGVGRVFTSMNNMWEVWSLDFRMHLSKQASFELFTLGDSDTIHRRKPLTYEQQVSRLRGEIEKASKSGNWKRVATLGKLLDRMVVKQKAAA